MKCAAAVMVIGGLAALVTRAEGPLADALFIGAWLSGAVAGVWCLHRQVQAACLRRHSRATGAFRRLL